MTKKTANDKLDGSKLKENPGPMPVRKMSMRIRPVETHYDIYLDKRGDASVGDKDKIESVSQMKDAVRYCEGYIAEALLKDDSIGFEIIVEHRENPASGLYVDRGRRKAKSAVL